jgi:DNA-binding beta-propeller fold protein YncE
LHLDAINQTGTGSTNVVFSFDTNPGSTRSGTLTIGDQILTITQAGSTYVAAGSLTALVTSGLHYPSGVAVDGDGNVYIANNNNGAINKWIASNNSVTALVTNGLTQPNNVAVDREGNVYIADSANNAIKKWTAADSNVTTLISSGFFYPSGVAVDSAGNVYIADTVHSAIKMWTASNRNLTTLVSSGLNNPYGVAADIAGNIYIADTYNNAVEKWTAANSNLTTLVSSGLNYPYGVAVDGAGNVFIADTQNYGVKKWTAASGTVSAVVSSQNYFPKGVALDASGNLYIAADANNNVKELPYAFVDTTTRLEGANAGSDSLPAVLPVTENLNAPFAPVSDQPWLTITGTANGIVTFSFTANDTGATRTANITVLGQTIAISQGAGVTPTILIGTTFLENGSFQFAFSNANPALSFTVLSSTDLSLPLTNWTVSGTPVSIAPGLFQFTAPPAPNDPQRFYRLRSP